MKKVFVFALSLIIVSFVFISCASDEAKKSENASHCKKEEVKCKEESKIEHFNVEIPDELKDKPEVIEYINAMNLLANEYANMVESIYIEAGDLAGVPEEQLSFSQKMKLVKIAGKSAVKLSSSMAKWVEYQEKRNVIEKDLTEAELDALSVVWKNFEMRMSEIEKKYNKSFANE